MNEKINKIINKITEYSKHNKVLNLTEQEFEILGNMITEGHSVEDFLYAKGKCLKERWIEIK